MYFLRITQNGNGIQKKKPKQNETKQTNKQTIHCTKIILSEAEVTKSVVFPCSGYRRSGYPIELIMILTGHNWVHFALRPLAYAGFHANGVLRGAK